MAIYHMTTKVIGRGGGASAVAASAYRSGEKLKDARRNETHDYTRKKGVVYTEIMTPYNAPEWSKKREVLWNEAEAIEKRKDARIAREIEVAIPVELDRRLQIDLIRNYVSETFVSEGMAADIAIHDKGDGNPHAHVMLTTREVTEAGFGGKSKNDRSRTWNAKETLEKWREAWEASANRALEKAGLDGRIDRRTLEAQGIERIPQIHVGSFANAMPDSDRKAANEAIKEANAKRESLSRSLDEWDRQLSELEDEIAEALAGQEREAAFSEPSEQARPDGEEAVETETAGRYAALQTAEGTPPIENTSKFVPQGASLETPVPDEKARLSDRAGGDAITATIGATETEAVTESQAPVETDIQAAIREGRAGFRGRFEAWKKAKAEDMERKLADEQRKAELEREARAKEQGRGGYSR